MYHSTVYKSTLTITDINLKILFKHVWIAAYIGVTYNTLLIFLKKMKNLTNCKTVVAMLANRELKYDYAYLFYSFITLQLQSKNA